MLTIQGVPVSAHTRKVILAARYKGLEYTIDPVIPLQPPPGWDELSPLGLIPVLIDGGQDSEAQGDQLVVNDSSVINAGPKRTISLDPRSDLG